MNLKKSILAVAIALVLCTSSFLVACKSKADTLKPDPAVTAVINLIDAIPADVTAQNKTSFADAITDAENAYNNLKNTQLQEKVTNFEKIAQAKDKLAAYDKKVADDAKIAGVIALINAIPGTVTNRDAFAKAIADAEAAYNALASGLRSSVTNHAKIAEAKTKLTAYDKKVSDDAKVSSVWNLINAIPATVTDSMAFDTAIKTAEGAYNGLDESLRTNAMAEAITTAKAKLKVFTDNASVANVQSIINALPGFVDDTNREGLDAIVGAAQSAYNALDAALKARVDIAKLTLLQGLVQDYDAVEAVNILIIAIPPNVSYDSDPADIDAFRAATETARNAFDNLAAALQARVMEGDEDARIIEAESTLAGLNEQQDNASVASVQSIINALPEFVDDTNREELEGLIGAAQAAYAALDTLLHDIAKKADVDTTKLDTIKGLVQDYDAVEAVNILINAIPEDVSISSASIAIDAFRAATTLARNAFDNLGSTLQERVMEGAEDARIIEAEGILSGIDAQLTAAGLVTAQIAALVTVTERAHIAAVEAADVAYIALGSAAVQAWVPNYDVITAAKARIVELEKINTLVEVTETGIDTVVTWEFINGFQEYDFESETVISYNYSGLTVEAGQLTDTTVSDTVTTAPITSQQHVIAHNALITITDLVVTATIVGKTVIPGDIAATSMLELRLYNIAYARANDFGAVEMFSHGRAHTSSPAVYARGHTIVNYDDGNPVDLYGATFAKGNGGLSGAGDATQLREWYYDGEELRARSAGVDNNTGWAAGSNDDATVLPNTTGTRNWNNIVAMTTRADKWVNFKNQFETNPFAYIPYDVNNANPRAHGTQWLDPTSGSDNSNPGGGTPAPFGLVDTEARGKLTKTGDLYEFTFLMDGNLTGNRAHIEWAGGVNMTAPYPHSSVTFVLDSSMKFIRYHAIDRYTVDGVPLLGTASTNTYATMHFVYHEKNVTIDGHVTYRAHKLRTSADNLCDCVDCGDTITGSGAANMVVADSDYTINLDWMRGPRIENIANHSKLLTNAGTPIFAFATNTADDLVLDIDLNGNAIITEVRRAGTPISEGTAWSFDPVESKLTIYTEGLKNGTTNPAAGAVAEFAVYAGEYFTAFRVAFPYTGTHTVGASDTGNMSFTAPGRQQLGGVDYDVSIFDAEGNEVWMGTRSVGSIISAGTTFTISRADFRNYVDRVPGTYKVVYGRDGMATNIGHYTVTYTA